VTAVVDPPAPAAVEPAPPRQLHGIGARRAHAVWLAACSVYVLAVMFRASLGVAGLAATERFGITASQLATFTVVQLAVYAAMQVPVGVLLDRFGSRRMLLSGLVFMTLGQIGFAVSASFGAGLASRALTGLGDAMVFTSVLRLVGLWFPARRVPIVGQLTGQLGLIGSIAATVPLARALEQLGWETTFLAAASMCLVSAAGVLLLVRDTPYVPVAPDPIRVRATASALRDVWGVPGTRLGLWTHFTTAVGPMVLTLLWGYPFLVLGLRYSADLAGSLLIAMTGASAVAAIVIGRLCGHRPILRSQIALGIVTATVFGWIILLAWPGTAPLPLVALVLVVTATGGPASAIGMDMARSYNPRPRHGSALGIVNVGGFTATLVAMALVGAVLDWRAPGGPATYTLDDFRLALSVLFGFWAVGATQIWRYRRRTIRLLEEHHPDALAALQRGDLYLPGISR